MKVEFFVPEDGTEIMVRIDNGISTVLDYTIPEHKQLIMVLFSFIKEHYPKAFNCLHELYSRSAQYHYLVVRRFIKCNLSKFDSVPDFDDSDFEFHFEQISCPMRGECKHENIICNPKLSNTLSCRELEVAKLIAENMTDVEISNELHIPFETVCSRRKAILKKLNLPNKQAIALWYFKIYNNPTL
jgi:DNA-binding CsgD family transcriptional regulator